MSIFSSTRWPRFWTTSRCRRLWRTSTPAWHEDVGEGLRRGAVGDDGRRGLQLEGADRGVAAELAVVGEQHRPARLLDQDPAQLRFLVGIVHPAIARVAGRDAHEDGIEDEAADEGHGVAADQRVVVGADPAGRRLDLEAGCLGQEGGDVERVGHDREPARIGERAGEGHRRRARVDEDRHAVLDHLTRNDSQLRLLARFDPRADDDRLLLVGPEQDRSAMHPAQPAGSLQRGQVAADGLRADAERARDLADRDPAVALQRRGGSIARGQRSAWRRP